MKRTIGRTIGLLVASAAVAMAPTLPAQAIVNGTADSTNTYVGEAIYYDPSTLSTGFAEPGGWHSCTATLVTTDNGDLVALTAGHCTYGVGVGGQVNTTTPGTGGTDVWVNFNEYPGYPAGMPSSSCFWDAAGYTPTGNNCPATTGGGNAARYASWTTFLDDDPAWVSATASTLPGFDPSTFYLSDVGVLVLRPHGPQNNDMPSTSVVLPSQGLIDTLYKGDKNATYTTIGMGADYASPNGIDPTASRNDGTVTITNTTGVFGIGSGVQIAYSNNNGKNHQGGTCYGDSGGPTFPNDPAYPNVMITITSSSPDYYCSAGTTGFRLDQAGVLSWLATFGVQ